MFEKVKRFFRTASLKDRNEVRKKTTDIRISEILEIYEEVRIKALKRGEEELDKKLSPFVVEEDRECSKCGNGISVTFTQTYSYRDKELKTLEEIIEPYMPEYHSGLVVINREHLYCKCETCGFDFFMNVKEI